MPISRFIHAGPPVDEQDIVTLEHELGFELPTEYRAFLRRTNGGRPEPEEAFPFGPEQPEGSLMSKFFHVKGGRPYDTITRRYAIFQGRVPSELLPIGSDASGNLICLGIKGERFGRIYFWSMEDERDGNRWGPTYRNVWEIASSFDDFIASFSVGPEVELTEEELRWNNIE